RAVSGYGMQALCCLNPTLVIGPGDQSPGEFRVRPYLDTAKGTGAQHRQAIRPTPPLRPQEASILRLPPTPQHKGDTQKNRQPKGWRFLACKRLAKISQRGSSALPW